MTLNNSNQYLPGVIAIPSTLQITAISRSNPMVMDTTYEPVTAVNTYMAGQLVKLIVPKPYGMYQANGLVGRIISVNGSIFTIALDSSQFDAFVIPPITVEQPASIAPAGSRNLEFNNYTRDVPFQSLNNIGN